VSGQVLNQTAFALKVAAGEQIEHFCPSIPPGVDVRTAPETDHIWLWIGVGIVYVAVFWFGQMSYLMRGSREHDEGDDEESITGSEDEDDAGPDFWTACCWRLPFRPATTLFTAARLEGILNQPFATREERRQLHQTMPEKTPPPVVRYMSWRRCSLAMLLTMGVGYYLMQLRVLSVAMNTRDHFVRVSNAAHLKSFEAWVVANPAIPRFIDYSMEKLWALFAGLLGEVLHGFIVVQIIVCILQLPPLVMLSTAARHWTSYVLSRKLVLSAWGAAFLTPLVVSMVPLATIINFSDITQTVDAYVHEFAVALHLDRAQDLLFHACDAVATNKLETGIDDISGSVRSTCEILSNFPIKMAMSCGPLSHSLCNIDLAQAIDACRGAVGQLESGNAAGASKLVQDSCREIKGMFADVDRDQGRRAAFDLLTHSLQLPFNRVVWGIGLITVTASLIHIIFTLIPPVAAVLPAFINGGIATKGLFPHSALPGVIIVLGPAFFLTGAWIVTTVIIHYISDPFAHALILCALLGPAAFVVAGALFKVTQPSDSDRFGRAMGWLKFISYWTFVVISVLVIYLVKEFRRFVEELAVYADWLHLSWGSLCVSCAMGIVYFFTLTCFGAIDWLVLDISKQKRYWHAWSYVTLKNLGWERLNEFRKSLGDQPDEDTKGWIGGDPPEILSIEYDMKERVSRSHLNELFKQRASRWPGKANH
jgi:hypothetical protein